MKTNNDFQDTIKAYLDQRAAEDPLFAKSYAKENKSLEECFSYIMGEALKSSVEIRKNVKGTGMSKDEVYNLAIHYYDEDDIKVNKLPTNTKSYANVPVTKPAEVKKEPKPKKKEDIGQLSLFEI